MLYLTYYFYALPFYMVLCTIKQVLLHFHQPTKILMYSYTISKKELDFGSSLASACNDSNL